MGVNRLQCKQTCMDNSGEKVLVTPDILPQKRDKEKYVKKCTQTAVWSDSYYLYSSGIFTHRFLFPVYIFKDPAGDPYFLSEKLSFCMYCGQSGVLAVH